jgi:hypothetical protein
MSNEHLGWWSNLRHGGLLLDLQRLSNLVPTLPSALPEWKQERLRREVLAFQNEPGEKRGKFVSYVLEDLCGFTAERGAWNRGNHVATTWTRRGLTGESLRPNHLWLTDGGTLPVFIDDEKRLGIGRGKRSIARALQWLRQGEEQLAVVTNGFQWRILFAGLDYEAFCEWELDQWLAEGTLSDTFEGFRSLVTPDLWVAPTSGQSPKLLATVNESRKGQSDLSKTLGERVRQAAELLIDGHQQVLNPLHDQLDPQDIYRAAVRVIMRMVVTLFAESREGLLPRDSPVFHNGYSLQGLREQLDRTGQSRRVASHAAWPRVIALFNLIYHGSAHEAMPVPHYGGELFAPGNATSPDGMKRALHVFEDAWSTADIMNDALVRNILDLLTRTKVRIRQGRVMSETVMPVDFASLDSEYIGILYEGLLDFELRCGVDGQPIVFLAVGNQPALPLATLEAMDDRAVKNLFEKLKDTSTKADKEEEGEEEEGEVEDEADLFEEEVEGEEVLTDEEAEAETEVPSDDDPRFTLRARAEAWARKAAEAAGLVKKPRGAMTPERQMAYDRDLASKARQMITKVVMPGEWYLVRWGGTRKGSGTFYTRPQLAIPTVHRTLRPLAYTPPTGEDGQPMLEAPAEQWTPKKPEEILALKVCDPACGSGSFPLAALRYLTNALYESLQVHNRIQDRGGQAVLDLIFNEDGSERLAGENLPCRPDDDEFEPRTKAILRRYVVERCIYGVDLDPLAVELCRLSLWIETLDKNLPLTFLNHKIKCGNGLVGAWFDQFLHYPAMAWNREGGDKAHTNGVHFAKEVWTKALKEKANLVKAELKDYIDGGTLFFPVDLSAVRTEHDAAVQALRAIHNLGIAQADERAERYEALINDPDFIRLKDAFDLWCALWFWPPDLLDLAPMPLAFQGNTLSNATHARARQVAAERRFFHWELEFPDVFDAAGQGFDGVLGNPPWENAQPNPEEYFSSIDPLFRTYGQVVKTEARQDLFKRKEIETNWLYYCYGFKCFANWVAFAARPFGDDVSEDTGGRKSHALSLGDRGARSLETSLYRHHRWKQKREETSGYADVDHCFRHQLGRIFTYKLFLEQGHALLRVGGRLGFIVPSGVYSDAWSKPLRRLFLNECRWEWIFGFENREAIFDIHRSFKFNPIIIQKGGSTAAIRTAFMRRNLADWERGEDFATAYPRERVQQFSSNSLAILEIQSQRDLEVLTKIYANSVLLGDQGPDGWGIKCKLEFMMNTDAKLFPPRTKWEEWGYRPDEYSRWIQGPWKPIAELWTELGVDPSKPVPIDVACAQRIRDGIVSGDVASTNSSLRCAQHPYDCLPIPRADLPAGVILSRDATHWLREEEIPVVTFTEANGRPLKVKVENQNGEKEEILVEGPALAVPLYQGIMTNQLLANRAHFGTTTSGKWNILADFDSVFWPKYLIARSTAVAKTPSSALPKLVYRSIARTTDSRTIIGTPIPELPAGNSLGVINSRNKKSPLAVWTLAGILSSYLYDWQMRRRIAGTNINMFYLDESAVPAQVTVSAFICRYTLAVASPCWLVAEKWIQARHDGIVNAETPVTMLWAIEPAKRIEYLAMMDAMALASYGLIFEDALTAIESCDLSLADLPSQSHDLNSVGFWRVDKDQHPEHRHTVLTLVAFHDLQEKIAACGGDVERGIEAFCAQNDGEGWMLPETLRLADYGLGHDDRAQEHQPVRAHFGPRFYDWQLAQTPEESWRECHLHARNLLGPEGYQALLDELAGKPPLGGTVEEAPKPEGGQRARVPENGNMELFSYQEAD